jgi:hypothetical protein
MKHTTELCKISATGNGKITFDNINKYLWDLAQLILLNRYQSFGRSYCFLLEGKIIQKH